jgi:hypothetical protein
VTGATGLALGAAMIVAHVLLGVALGRTAFLGPPLAVLAALPAWRNAAISEDLPFVWLPVLFWAPIGLVLIAIGAGIRRFGLRRTDRGR